MKNSSISSLLAVCLAACGLLLPANAGWSQVTVEGTIIVDQAQKAAKAGPVFKDGQAQVVRAFRNSRDWIKEELWVETEFNTDGDTKNDRMHVTLTRQRQTDTEGLKVPVIYTTSPYFAGVSSTAPDVMWNPRHELGETPPERKNPSPIVQQPMKAAGRLIATWVPRGFAVVQSCSPGTGRSQGCPTVGGPNESLAPKAVIDWLNGRAKGFTTPDGNEEIKATWCTGKVGMTGTSYNGTLPLAAATTGVEGLEAIIPVAPNTSYYHYYRSNGLVRHPGGYMGEDIDVLYNFIHSGDPAKREYCDCNVRDEVMAKQMDRESGDYNEFWKGRDYLNQLGNMKAAMLMAHGFNDWNVMPEHSVRIYDALNKKGHPVQCYFHQAGHGGDPPLKLMNRWFTRYLYDVQNGVEKDPKAWIVREGKSTAEPTAYADYPNPAAAMVKLHMNGGGKSAGTLSQSAQPTPGSPRKLTFTDNFNIGGVDLAKSAVSNNRLLFATQTLKEPLHLSGYSTLKIRVAASKAAANLSVWMVSLPIVDGGSKNSNLITRGWADPQNSKSISESQPLKPGEFVDLEFQLQPDDQVIPVGQQIGLMIFSSDKAYTLWPEPGTELTVDLDGTSIEIPVVGGAEAFKKATR